MLYGHIVIRLGSGITFSIPDMGDIITAIATYRILRRIALDRITNNAYTVDIAYWTTNETFNRDARSPAETFASIPLDSIAFDAHPDHITVKVD